MKHKLKRRPNIKGIGADARALGVSRFHLQRVCVGTMASRRLSARFIALLESQGRPIPPAATALRRFRKQAAQAAPAVSVSFTFRPIPNLPPQPPTPTNPPPPHAGTV